MPLLLPHVFAVRSADDLVLMDVRADTYSLISDAFADDAAGEMLHPLATRVTADVGDALRDAGLVTVGVAVPATPLPAPTMRHGVASTGWGRQTPRDVFDLAAAVLRSRHRLRRGLPCRSYRRTRTTPVAPAGAVEHAMAGLTGARLLVPCPTRCLPASMITSFFLAQRGIASEIVFGVRTHPFAAHCWVEVDGVLVDDEPDRVRAYHPICVADA